MTSLKGKISNAALGRKFERKLRKAINKNNNIAVNISNAIYNTPGAFKTIYVVGDNNEKNDLIIEYNFSKIIGINLKSGSADLNQVMRLWPKDLNSFCHVSKKGVKIIERCLLTAALKKGFLMNKKDKNIVRAGIESKLTDVLKFIFTRNNNSVNVLGIIDLSKKTYKFYLYKMTEVIKYISSSKIIYSDKGVMNIGNYLIMKRKGGDGNSSKPKFLKKGSPNPSHPGNQLQFQMKILSFINDSKKDKTLPQPFLTV